MPIALGGSGVGGGPDTTLHDKVDALAGKVL